MQYATIQIKALLICVALLPTTSFAEGAVRDWYDGARARVNQVWTEGDNELYVTGYSWHNRLAYTKEKIRSFNETAWGGGIGRGLYDEDGDWHGLYAMAFLDSHSDVQPMVGYGFQKIKRVSENVRLGAGFTAFVTARRDIMSYVPFPAALPLVSVGYGRATLFAAYVPGKRGNGNVGFVFGKYAF